MNIECKNCNKKFKAKISAKRKYCSIFCYTQSQKINKLGNKHPNWKGGLRVCLKCGMPLSKYTYPKRGTKQCQKCYYEYLRTRPKEEIYNWKGGVAKTKEYKVHATLLRRYRARNIEGTHTLLEWEKLKKKVHYQCIKCFRFEPEIILTRDHIIPITKGGTNYISNIQPLCRSCNSQKMTTLTNYLISYFN